MTRRGASFRAMFVPTVWRMEWGEMAFVIPAARTYFFTMFWTSMAFMRDQPPLHVRAPTKSAHAAIGADDAMARHEKRRRVSGTRGCRGPGRGRAAGEVGEAAVGDDRAGRHLAQHVPRVFEEFAGSLCDGNRIHRGDVATVVGHDRSRHLTELGAFDCFRRAQRRVN